MIFYSKRIILALVLPIILTNLCYSQVSIFSDFRLEGDLTGFTKYKTGAPSSTVSASYPYVEYNDINKLSSNFKAELGVLYLPYGKNSSIGLKSSFTLSSGKIKQGFISGNDRTYNTNILSIGMKIYPFANNKNYSIGVNPDDTDEGKKFVGAIIGGFFLEFGKSLTQSSFERYGYLSSKYEIEKVNIKKFSWGESISVLANERFSIGIEASYCRYAFDLPGGNEGRKKIKTIHAGLWAAIKLH